MLERLKLKNFQAHVLRELDFDERVTTIVGPSDVGKSSIIRALRWASLNVPVSSLVHDGAKEASVRLVVDAKHVVRERGTENTYSLDAQEYKAFRTSVPDDIAAILQLDEVNFQNQHDPVYWFSCSSGEVSRQLNAIVDLGVIDAAMAAINQTFHKCRVKTEITEERLQEAIVRRDALAWVVEADTDLVTVESAGSVVDGLRSSISELRDLLGELGRSRQRKEELAKRYEDVKRVAVAARSVGVADKAVRELSVAIDAVVVADERRSVEVPDLAELEEGMRRVAVIKDEIEPLWTAVKNLTSMDYDAKQARLKAIETERVLEEKTRGAVCPLCGSSLK